MGRLEQLQTSIDTLTASVEQLSAFSAGDTARVAETAKSQIVNQVIWAGTLALDANGLAHVDAGASFGSLLVVNHSGTALWVWAGDPDIDGGRPGIGRHLVRPSTEARLAIVGSSVAFLGAALGIIGLHAFTTRADV